MLQAFSAGSCSGWLVHAVLFEKRRGKRKEGEEEGGGERKREMAGGRGGGASSGLGSEGHEDDLDLRGGKYAL